MYQWLSKKWVRTSEVFRFDDFELRDGELYYKGKSKPLTHGKGRLRMAKEIKKILGERRLQDLGFDIPKDEVTAKTGRNVEQSGRRAPSVSDVGKAK